MEIVRNPQDYDSKVPTNVRIIGTLKTLALKESERRGVTLAQIVNEALANHYNVEYDVLEARCKEETANEHSDS